MASDALYPYGEFETSDTLTAWQPSTDGVASAQLISPGYNSAQAVYLEADSDGAIYLDMSVDLISGMEYTMSFDYRLDAEATCEGSNDGPMELFVELMGAGFDAEDDFLFSTPTLAYVQLFPGTTPDTLGGVAGTWNSAVLNPFVVSGSDNPQITVEYDANYCSGGIQLDNIQLLASIPAAPTDPAVYPSCTNLPNLPSSDSTATSSSSMSTYTVRTFPNLLVISKDSASSMGTTKVSGVAACQNLLAGTNDGQGFAQYDSNTGFCTVFAQGVLCDAYQLIESTGNYYAIGFA